MSHAPVTLHQGEPDKEKVVRLFTPKRIEIEAPEGVEIIAAYERHAEQSMIEYERLHDLAVRQIIEIMGTATVMRFPDGSRYERKVIQRQAMTIDPDSYSALVFRKADE